MQQQSSGGGEPVPGRSGLARYRSAPATWLEALLEEDEEEDDPLRHNQSLTQLLASNTTTPSRNLDDVDQGGYFVDAGTTATTTTSSSSTAEFLGTSVDGYFSNYAASFDYMPSPASAAGGGGAGGGGGNLDVGIVLSGKRDRETPQLKVEQNAHLPSRISSLPEADMDRLLDESVPFRVRAKRGCATHPRSIAERVRRTKISDRIRKLQELVPNMDKQTNTADMLDEAVEYVKYLQKQIQELKEQQKNCKCTIKD